LTSSIPEPQRSKVAGNGLDQLRRLGLLPTQRRCQPLHLLLERLAVVLLLLGAVTRGPERDPEEPL
jgi:hypothetical protein